MLIYILCGILLLVVSLIVAIKGLRVKHSLQDSILKQRAIFKTQHQLTFIRLKQLLPHCSILAHVSYDSLLTTKFAHTREKYKTMIADFVVLDVNYHVIVIINLDTVLTTKRVREVRYEEEILKSAGYKVLHYKILPELDDLISGLAQFTPRKLTSVDQQYKKLEFLGQIPTVKIVL